MVILVILKLILIKMLATPLTHYTRCFGGPPSLEAIYKGQAIANLLAQSKVSTNNKAEIIKAILQQENFTESETWRPDVTENFVYLLRRNVPIKHLPRVRAVRFVVITPQQIQEMKKTGVEYYSFGRFRRKKSVVSVAVTREYTGQRNSNGGTVIYTCRRVGGGWQLTPHAGPAYTAERK